MNKKVSVIIPSYNSELYLTQALESVLAQNNENLEIIVVDDGSTDQTKKIAESFPVKLYSIAHQGIAAARNFGIEKSSAEIIAFLDSDDLWIANKTNLQLSKLVDPFQIVIGHLENFISPDVGDLQNKLDYPKGRQVGFHPGAMLIKRNVFNQVGLFSVDFKIGEFVEWFSRVKEKNINYLVLDDLVMRRRIHQQNTTRVVGDLSAEYLKIVKTKIKSTDCK